MKNILVLGCLMFAVAFTFSFAMDAEVSLAKSDKAMEKSQGKENPSVANKEKVSVKQEAKNYEKAERKSLKEPKESRTPGKSNAKLHKEKIKEVSQNLQEIAEEEETAGNEEASETIEEVAEESEETKKDAAESIVEVESRGKFQKLLIGTDYKNLGQLRSSLVKNRNQIRKLTRTVAKVQPEEQKTSLEEQLVTLTQERERIKSVITDNEDGGFSFLGWAFRLISGYPKNSINEVEENELLEEVQEAVESSSDAQGTAENSEVQ